MKETRTRGLLPGDDKAFSLQKAEILRKAQVELQFLLDRGYPMKSAVTYVCNHHQLSARQALALTRSTSTSENIRLRESKRLAPEQLKGQTVYIDGFNLIITLEVALSDGILLTGQDGCIRDLAELRGSYRIIPHTQKAIEVIRDELEYLQVSNIVIMLDEPVSNSGRLKAAIYEINWRMPVDVLIVRNPDALLKQLPHVVSCDANILDECQSWVNLTAHIFHKNSLFQNLCRLVKLKDEV